MREISPFLDSKGSPSEKDPNCPSPFHGAPGATCLVPYAPFGFTRSFLSAASLSSYRRLRVLDRDPTAQNLPSCGRTVAWRWRYRIIDPHDAGYLGHPVRMTGDDPTREERQEVVLKQCDTCPCPIGARYSPPSMFSPSLLYITEAAWQGGEEHEGARSWRVAPPPLLPPFQALVPVAAMDRLSLILSSILAGFFCLQQCAAEEGPVIRQVVSESGGASEADEALLNAEGHFAAFLKTYGKAYATPEEHSYRFSVFSDNLRRARRHQLLDPSALHGVTPFSDLTQEEFEKGYLGLHRRRPALFSAAASGNGNEAPILPTTDLPEEFDWRQHGAVTPVKNQVGAGWSIPDELIRLFFFFTSPFPFTRNGFLTVTYSRATLSMVGFLWILLVLQRGGSPRRGQLRGDR